MPNLIGSTLKLEYHREAIYAQLPNGERVYLQGFYDEEHPYGLTDPDWEARVLGATAHDPLEQAVLKALRQKASSLPISPLYPSEELELALEWRTPNPPELRPIVVLDAHGVRFRYPGRGYPVVVDETLLSGLSGWVLDLDGAPVTSTATLEEAIEAAHLALFAKLPQASLDLVPRIQGEDQPDRAYRIWEAERKAQPQSPYPQPHPA